MSATFIASAEGERHGNPPAGMPLVVTLNASGFSVGDRLLLFLLQSAIAGNFDTWTVTPSWGTPIFTDSLATAVSNTVYRKKYAGEASVTIQRNNDVGSLPLLFAALVCGYNPELKPLEDSGANNGANTPNGLATADAEALAGFFIYRPNDTPAVLTGTTLEAQTDFAGQLGAGGVSWHDLLVAGPAAIPVFNNPTGDATSRNDALIFGSGLAGVFPGVGVGASAPMVG